MKKIAVFPGSFSPFTFGHKSIVERTLPLFDKLIIAIGINSNKTNKFDSEKNQKWIQSLFANENKIEVILVRSATEIRNDIIDHCPQLKLSEEVVLEWIILMLNMPKRKGY